MRLWDTGTQRLKAILVGHTDAVKSIVYSADGTTIATGSSDRTVRLWDAATGQYKTSLIGHTDSVNSVAYSPDSSTIATGSRDKTVRLWDADTGQHKRTFTGDMEQINCLAYSPDGATIAIGNGYDKVHFWDIATGQLKPKLSGNTDYIRAIAYSLDGKTLASASGYNTVHLWDVASGQLKTTFVGHAGNVHSIVYSPDGKTLASASFDGTILLWDIPAPSTTTLSLKPTVGQIPSAIGQRLTFSINIANGESIAGYQTTVLFDSAVLRYIESADGSYLGGYLPAGVFSIPPIVTEKGVTLAATTLAGESSGDGTLVTVSFEVITVKESVPTLSNALLTQGTGKSVIPQIVAAQKTKLQEKTSE